MKKTMLAGMGLTLALAGCGGGGSVSRSLDTAPPAVAGSVADYPVKLGEPYELEGVTYTPEDVYNYDETGYASWYGQELSGRRTSNGEMFNAEAITGAHRTLPLPSYVEVTSLDTGKTILVRLNDRGPSSPKRLIDLSYGAAKQLGVLEKGTFAVRVRRVNAPEGERAVLRSGQPVAARMDTPESLLVPLRRKLDGKPRPDGMAAAPATPAPVAAQPQPGKPAMAAKPSPRIAPPAPKTLARTPPAPAPGTDRFIVEGEGGRPSRVESSPGDNRASLTPAPPAPVPAAAASGYFVQVAAFSSRGRAEDLARRIGAKAQQSPDGKVYRVRYGPYPNADAAREGLTLAQRNGYQGARIQQDSSR